MLLMIWDHPTKSLHVVLFLCLQSTTEQKGNASESGGSCQFITIIIHEMKLICSGESEFGS